MSREDQYKVADVYSGTNPRTIAMLETVRADMIRTLDLIDKRITTEVTPICGIISEPPEED